MKKTLIVYAGDFKTGTSTAQSILARNTSLLKAQGVLYPSAGRKALNSHRLLMEDLKNFNNKNDLSLENWHELNEEIEKSNCNTILIAQEAFQNFINTETWKAVETISLNLNIKLLYYIRPHCDVFLSRFTQRLKFGKANGQFEDFFEQSLSERLFFFEDKHRK